MRWPTYALAAALIAASTASAVAGPGKACARLAADASPPERLVSGANSTAPARCNRAARSMLSSSLPASPSKGLKLPPCNAAAGVSANTSHRGPVALALSV